MLYSLRSRYPGHSTGKAKAKKNRLGFHRGLRTTQQIDGQRRGGERGVHSFCCLICFAVSQTSGRVFETLFPSSLWAVLRHIIYALHLPSHHVRSSSFPVISSPSFFLFSPSPHLICIAPHLFVYSSDLLISYGIFYLTRQFSFSPLILFFTFLSFILSSPLLSASFLLSSNLLSLYITSPLLSISFPLHLFSSPLLSIFWPQQPTPEEQKIPW